MVALESKLQVPPGTLTKLLFDDNDWSFLIRLQVFIEATLAHAIKQALKGSKPDEYVDDLRLRARGKGASLQRYGRELDLLGADDEAYITALATTRNRFAHDLANISRPLSAYLLSLPHEDFVSRMTGLHYMANEPWLLGALGPHRALLANQVRKAIWQGALVLCSKLAELSLTDEERAAVLGPRLA